MLITYRSQSLSYARFRKLSMIVFLFSMMFWVGVGVRASTNPDGAVAVFSE